MTDLTLTRIFTAPPEKVFAYLTQHDHQVTWWGPEDVNVVEGQLDFTKPGPWVAVMQNKDGQRFKVSGDVIEVTHLKRIVYTWGWHDDTDTRGHESTVTATITPHPDGTQYTMIHSGLADEDSRDQHSEGWTSCLRKLTKLMNT